MLTTEMRYGDMPQKEMDGEGKTSDGDLERNNTRVQGRQSMAVNDCLKISRSSLFGNENEDKFGDL